MAPELETIDHIHVYVTNRVAAENWYHEYLGFQRMRKFEQWIEKGPLTIANGNVHLALFELPHSQKTTVAFGVGCNNFIKWMEHLKNKSIDFRLSDHKLSWSVYFCDPDGNPFEITSYAYDEIAQVLRAKT